MQTDTYFARIRMTRKNRARIRCGLIPPLPTASACPTMAQNLAHAGRLFAFQLRDLYPATPELLGALRSTIARSRARLAKRKSAKPDCRVPRNSPGPRSPRSASAILKAVGFLFHYAQSLAGDRAAGAVIDEKTDSPPRCRARPGRAVDAVATGRNARRARRPSPLRWECRCRLR